MSGSAWDCDRGYVAFLKATYPLSLSPSGLMDGHVAFPSHRPRHRLTDVTGVLCVSTALAVSVGCDGGCVAFWFPWRHGVCRLLRTAGLKPGRPSPSPSLAPLLPPLSLALSELPTVLGCLPRVEAAVLRRVTLRSCRGCVRAVCMISMLPSPVCSVSPVSGRFPEEESPEPPIGLKATYPVSPPDCPETGRASAASVFALLYRGTCASSLVRSHTSRSPGAWHLKACPVREVVTVTWDPVLGSLLREYSGLRVCSSWQLLRRTLELRGKRWLGQWRVSLLQSSRGWSGMPRTVWSSTRRRPASPIFHCLAPCGPGTAWGGESSQQRQGTRRAEETGR
ncbi:hypothetical protein Taro_032563 [Colocasia esculenta]|uniref:Uncharacterized protein n=1 Tax=Colocasia esculenta TaxID=4460 RepID=A0A843VLM8_COLES|nr:hypothetical protein [Colocasia esculenta]